MSHAKGHEQSGRTLRRSVRAFTATTLEVGRGHAPTDDDPRGPAARLGVGTAHEQVGMELPHDVAVDAPLVERAFAFVDLCGFTAYMAEHGERHAREEIRRFRDLAREIATRRGIGIAKWLGDGAMMVGTSVGPTIAAATELTARYRDEPMALRGGVAHGETLLFDGDDYLGQPANLAARLCQAARPGEVLTVGYPAASLPTWIQIAGTRDLTLRGLGRFHRVQRLALVDGLDLRMLDARPVTLPPDSSSG